MIEQVLKEIYEDLEVLRRMLHKRKCFKNEGRVIAMLTILDMIKKEQEKNEQI